MKRIRPFLAVLLSLFCIFSSAYAEALPDVWTRAAVSSLKGVESVRLYGFNGAVTTTFEAVWPESADYVPQVTALSSPYCASASANDTSAGTGARTIRVTGIDTSFAAFSEDVTMNGQTSVPLTTSNVLLFNSGEVLTAGSGNMAAGIIQCGTGVNTAGDPAVTHLYIAAGSETAVTGSGNKTAAFIYGVPANHKMVCRNIAAGSVFATAASGFNVRIHSYTDLSPIHKLLFGVHGHNTGSNPSLTPDHIVIPEKTIIVGKIAGPTGSLTGPVSLSAECLLLNMSEQSVF